MSYTIKQVDPNNHQDIVKCFCAFAVLRPHLIEANFVEVVRAQAKEGYRIAYIESDSEVVAATGFRVLHFLAWGKVLYIDDLITLPSKKRAGLGGARSWIGYLASANCVIATQCTQIVFEQGIHAELPSFSENVSVTTRSSLSDPSAGDAMPRVFSAFSLPERFFGWDRRAT
jgi:hypothetical protein